jgi:hypothetical protein
MTRIEKQPSNAPVGTLANALKHFTLNKSDKALSLRLARPESSTGNAVGKRRANQRRAIFSADWFRINQPKTAPTDGLFRGL